MYERVTTELVIERSHRRGMPGDLLFAIFSTPVDGWAPLKPYADAHKAYLDDLQAEGVLFGTGPLCSEDGLHCDGDGLHLLRVASIEGARELADRDPMHRAGVKTYRIRPWILNQREAPATV